MNDPRIPMLPVDDAITAATSVKVHHAAAELSIFRILLKHPYLAKMVNNLIMNLIYRGTLDDRLRELIIMRLGWSTKSVYEWTQHWPIALDAGATEAEVLAVRDWRRHEFWSDLDRAILAATDETVENGAIGPATWAILAEHLNTEQELLEVPAVIGTWNFVSQILRSLDVPLEDGKAPWPPAGDGPDHADSGA